MSTRIPRLHRALCLGAGLLAALAPVPVAATDPGAGPLKGWRLGEEEPGRSAPVEAKAGGRSRSGARRARLQAELAARSATGAATPGEKTLRPLRNRQGETLHVGPCAPLAYADLSGLSLRGLNLDGADLRWARLVGIDLTGASLKGAQLSGADLTEAKGLDLAQARVHPFFAPWAETYDQGGRRVTYCARAGVGQVNCYGNLVPTSTFAVVTEYYWTADGGVHDVVTAYPVRD